VFFFAMVYPLSCDRLLAARFYSFAKSRTVVSPLSHVLVTLYLVMRHGLIPRFSSSRSRSSSASIRPCNSRLVSLAGLKTEEAYPVLR
jgi:hypothetical protein